MIHRNKIIINHQIRFKNENVVNTPLGKFSTQKLNLRYEKCLRSQ
jgi:hypothetical protein